MTQKQAIRIEVTYLDALKRLAGVSADQFVLNEGSSLELLIGAVQERYPQLSKGKDDFFVALNRKAVTAAQEKWGTIILQNSDRVMLGLKISGG